MIRNTTPPSPQGPLPHPLKSDVTPKGKGWGTLRCPGGVIREPSWSSGIPELVKGESHLPGVPQGRPELTPCPPHSKSLQAPAPRASLPPRKIPSRACVLYLDRGLPCGAGSLGILGFQTPHRWTAAPGMSPSQPESLVEENAAAGERLNQKRTLPATHPGSGNTASEVCSATQGAGLCQTQ